jgi:glycine betaine transporter
VNTKTKRIRWGVMLPPWLLVVAIVALNFINYDAFTTVMTAVTNWILVNFSWLFNGVTFFAVVLLVIAYFSPFAKVRIGGSKARPIMNYTNYTWIALCTILAAGILFWACAEPMYHIYAPPASVVDGPGSPGAVNWAMNIMFLEWTFSPLAIYGLAAIVFAFVFYNMKKQFSIGSMLYPALGDRYTDKLRPVVECICLFALCAGMAASLGVAVLLLSGGLSALTDGAIASNVFTYVVVSAVVVAAFVISACTGLMNGIRVLSSINVRIYLVLGLFVFLAGPTAYILDLMMESLGTYFNQFIQLSLFTGSASGDNWSRSWPTFYWCVYMAWMPVTAVFLGRISKGYTVRDAINILVIIPSLFSVLWLAIFSSAAINYELSGLGVKAAMDAGATEDATYQVLRNLPLVSVTIPLFLLITLVSFVTASDSNTNAMAGLCTTGISSEDADAEAPTIIKIIWGVTIGAMCTIMLSTFGLDGVKQASNLGGFPALFLFILIVVSFIKIMIHPQKYDTFKEDYDQYGRPIPSKRLDYEGKETEEKKSFLYRLFLS